MSKKRLTFYIIILIISVAMLTGMLLKKYLIAPLRSIDTGKAATVMGNNTSQTSLTKEIPSPEPSPSFWLPGGRDDPFALLPEEEVLKSLDANGIHSMNPDLPSETVVAPLNTPVPMLPVPEPVFPNDIHVRGIIISDTPQAIVDENGKYKKIVNGDAIAGGKVLRITEDGVYIQWNNKEICLKPSK